MLSASVTSPPLGLHLPGRARGSEQIETGNASKRALASLEEYEMVQGDHHGVDVTPQDLLDKKTNISQEQSHE